MLCCLDLPMVNAHQSPRLSQIAFSCENCKDLFHIHGILWINHNEFQFIIVFHCTGAKYSDTHAPYVFNSHRRDALMIIIWHYCKYDPSSPRFWSWTWFSPIFIHICLLLSGYVRLSFFTLIFHCFPLKNVVKTSCSPRPCAQQRLLESRKRFCLWITTLIVTVSPPRALTPTAKGEADGSEMKLQGETWHHIHASFPGNPMYGWKQFQSTLGATLHPKSIGCSWNHKIVARKS